MRSPVVASSPAAASAVELTRIDGPAQLAAPLAAAVRQHASEQPRIAHRCTVTCPDSQTAQFINPG
jgi:hypothetical protein